MQRSVSDATNTLLTKNAELLRQNSTEVARESERGIVDLETLKKVNADLISTIEETIKIQQEGRIAVRMQKQSLQGSRSSSSRLCLQPRKVDHSEKVNRGPKPARYKPGRFFHW